MGAKTVQTPLDIPQQTGASAGTPAAGTRRLFTDSATGEMSVRKSDGTTASLESGGGAATLTYIQASRFAP